MHRLGRQLRLPAWAGLAVFVATLGGIVSDESRADYLDPPPSLTAPADGASFYESDSRNIYGEGTCPQYFTGVVFSGAYGVGADFTGHGLYVSTPGYPFDDYCEVNLSPFMLSPGTYDWQIRRWDCIEYTESPPGSGIIFCSDNGYIASEVRSFTILPDPLDPPPQSLSEAPSQPPKTSPSPQSTGLTCEQWARRASVLRRSIRINSRRAKRARSRKEKQRKKRLVRQLRKQLASAKRKTC